jgi:O-antigen ligase
LDVARPQYSAVPGLALYRRRLDLSMPITSLFLFIYVISVVLFSQSPSTSLISTGVGVLLALVFVVELLLRRGTLWLPAPAIWMLIFVSYLIIQMIWAPGSISRLLTMVQLLILLVIVVNEGKQSGWSRSVEYGFYAATVMSYMFDIVTGQFFDASDRIGSTLLNANLYSFALMFGVLLAARRLVMGQLAHRIRPISAIALVAYILFTLYVLVYLAGSRKGMALTLVGLVFMLVFWIWQQPIERRVLLSAVSLLVFCAVGYFLYKSPQFARFADISNLLEGRTVEDTGLVKRTLLFRDAFDLWLQRPFTGWGLDQFRIVSGWGMYSHSNYVELLANHGLVGLLLYVGVYISGLIGVIRRIVRSAGPIERTAAAWSLLLLGLLVAWDFGAVSYYEKMAWMMVGAAVCVTSAEWVGMDSPKKQAVGASQSTG